MIVSLVSHGMRNLLPRTTKYIWQVYYPEFTLIFNDSVKEFYISSPTVFRINRTGFGLRILGFGTGFAIDTKFKG